MVSMVRGGSLRPYSDLVQRTANDSEPQKEKDLEKKEDEPSSEVPWYMRDPDSIALSMPTHAEPIPELPGSSPHSLEPIVHQMARELGLTEVEVLDLRDLDPPSSFGPNLIMVVASAKSERHLVRAATGLAKFVKNEFGVQADKDGILTANYHRVHQRRLKRKAKRQYFSVSEAETAASRKSEWVVMSCNLDGIVVQLFTGDRRQQVDLESLWKEQLDGEMESEVRGQGLAGSISNKQLGSRRGFHTVRQLSSQLKESDILQNPVLDQSKIVHELDEPDLKKLNELVEEGDYKGAVSFARSHSFSDPEGLVLKAHINHVSKMDGQLTHTSPVVQSFVSFFPILANEYKMRLRLLFFQAAHKASPNKFPLELLVDHLVFQQAAGVPASSWDVETIVRTVAYSAQDIRADSFDSITALDTWMEKCDYKFKLILRILDIGYRSMGRPISTSEVLMTLLYRSCIQYSPGYINMFSALKNPKPDVSLRRGVLDPRSFGILRLFPMADITTERSKNMVALGLVALANDGRWSEFFWLWNKLILNAKVDKSMALLMASLVVRASDERAIKTLLDVELPKLFEGKDGVQMLTPQLMRVIKRGVDYINPQGNGYPQLRALIGKVMDDTKQM
ncbi:hypothetical protein TRVA0_018S02762 [Trichomonascus vanleenenianus]|uniref:Atp25p n=1 Tax=Trichomonascus vanleenenianus TaxID=2268995 RepID=UPI003ECAE863